MSIDWSSWFEFSIYDGIFLVLILGLFIYWVIKKDPNLPPPPKPRNLLTMTDMTIEELKEYDGIKKDQILLALNGTIYDVTKGSSFYGVGKPYGTLAGHDATRALGKMDQNEVRDVWDDHKDLTESDISTATEWETSFKFKYETVGRLVRFHNEKATYGGRKSFIRGAESLENIISSS